MICRTAYKDGDGVKLCDEDRPPMESIVARLRERVPIKLSSLFIEDIQNDCTCATETYDSGWHEMHIFYTSPEGIKQHVVGDRLPLPMKPDFSEKDIWDLLEASSKLAATTNHNFNVLHKMLFNPESDVKKLWRCFEEHCYPITTNRSGDIMGWITAPFVPKDCAFFLPEPEFFGAISVNVDKFGAFCQARNMVRIGL